MRNSITFILLFLIFCFEALAEDQFIFNVSKIEILENGNKIVGIDRGIIESNSGIKIEADNFEYNKKNNILNVNGNVIINYAEKNYTIYAENISYLKNKNIIKAKNKIKFIDRKEKIITSNNFLLDITKNIFEAEGNVEIINLIKNYNLKSNNIIYFKNEERIISKGLTNALLNENYKFKSNQNLSIDLIDFEIKASGEVEFIDFDKKNKILTDEIYFYKDNEEIITEGKTEAKIENRFILKSKNIFFSNKNRVIKSKNKASINDIENDSYYEIDNFYLSLEDEILKGENISANTEYSQPLNNKYFIKSGMFDLKNKSFLTQDISFHLKKDLFNNKKNDPRLKGSSSSSKDGITVINKGIFTSCNKDDNDCPPWSIQAEKIIYDQNKEIITYDNALLKVYDKPIFYFPKFFHPGPTVKRKSGLLAPRLGNSKILGSSIQIPYFWATSENKDFTFTPTIYDKNIIKLQNEFRLKNKNSSFIGDFSFTEGYKSKTNKEKNSITHLFSKFSSNLDLENFNKSTLDISVERVNNDTYLKIFDQNTINEEIKPTNDDLLTSKIKINLQNDKFNLETGMSSYENLQKINSDRYEFILPYYNLSAELNDGKEYGYLNFLSQGSNILKNTNNLRSRIINDFDFRGLDLISKSGLQNNINIYVKNLITSGKNDEDYNSSVDTNLLGIFEFKSKFPMIKDNQDFINYLEPKISIRYNPSNMIDHSGTSRRINNDNIFDINRLGLDDTLESGASVTMGIDYKKENLNNINNYFELKLGTILRDKKNTNIPLTSGITEKHSNFYGQIRNNFNENIALNYDFSIDNSFNKIEYNSIGFEFAKNKFKTEINVIEENGVIGDSNFIENITSLILNENNTLSFKTRQNRKLNIAEYYDLIYEYKNDCLVAGITYNKTYYEDRDLIPSENLMFKLTLIPITTIGQSVSN
tara:strand:+ start:213 stop:3008 length:2796 start_codon:yes stop_codon:yes gene_type:complete